MSRDLKLDLNAHPMKVGTLYKDKGFGYSLIEVKPHTNRKGEPTTVASWRGTCADCGKSFDFKTGARIYQFPRRCPADAKGKGWEQARPWGSAPVATVAGLFRTQEEWRAARPMTAYLDENGLPDGFMDAEAQNAYDDTMTVRRVLLELAEGLPAHRDAVLAVRRLYDAWLDQDTTDTLQASDASPAPAEELSAEDLF